MYNSLVLHIPHAAIGGLAGAGYADRMLLFEQARRWTDWYTDYLFERRNPHIVSVKSIYSRFVVDCERLLNDPLEAKGQGILYERFEHNRRIILPEDRERLMAYYAQNRDRLRSAVTPGSLLIDCHSFPSDLGNVDVCIGYNEDWSKPDAKTLQMVRDTFEQAGYTVAFNAPYSNSVSPKAAFAYPSLMIEVNKRCYMDEDTIRLNYGCALLYDTITQLYTMLLND